MEQTFAKLFADCGLSLVDSEAHLGDHAFLSPKNKDENPKVMWLDTQEAVEAFNDKCKGEEEWSLFRRINKAVDNG